MGSDEYRSPHRIRLRGDAGNRDPGRLRNLLRRRGERGRQSEPRRERPVQPRDALCQGEAIRPKPIRCEFLRRVPDGCVHSSGTDLIPIAVHPEALATRQQVELQLAAGSRLELGSRGRLHRLQGKSTHGQLQWQSPGQRPATEYSGRESPSVQVCREYKHHLHQQQRPVDVQRIHGEARQALLRRGWVPCGLHLGTRACRHRHDPLGRSGESHPAPVARVRPRQLRCAAPVRAQRKLAPAVRKRSRQRGGAGHRRGLADERHPDPPDWQLLQCGHESSGVLLQRHDAPRSSLGQGSERGAVGRAYAWAMVRHIGIPKPGSGNVRGARQLQQHRPADPDG